MKVSTLAWKTAAALAAGIIAGAALRQVRAAMGTGRVRRSIARRKAVQYMRQVEADRREATPAGRGRIKDSTEPVEPSNETAAPAAKAPGHGKTEASSRDTAPDVTPRRRGGKPAQPDVEGLTKQQLYDEARKRNIRGRSTMTKAELRRALR